MSGVIEISRFHAASIALLYHTQTYIYLHSQPSGSLLCVSVNNVPVPGLVIVFDFVCNKGGMKTDSIYSGSTYK